MPKSFLKWPGGKYKLVNRLLPHLTGKRLVEPFVGAGNIAMSTDFDEYLLCDNNADLINVFQEIKEKKEQFIEELRPLFENGNDEDTYYKRRNEFNLSDDSSRKALLFVYLNRHGYNGLCRYNKNKGYNVPFGSHVNVYFPFAELKYFISIVDKCTFKCQGFEETFSEVKEGDVVYCDPPYIPTKSTSFTSYSSGGFPAMLHKVLAKCAKDCKSPVIVSNSDTELTRSIYKGAIFENFDVQRNISRVGEKRVKEKEVLLKFDKK